MSTSPADIQFRALTSASNFYRRKLCPGSEQAEYGLPEVEVKAPARDEGQLLHHKEYDEEEDRSDLRVHQVRALEKNKRKMDEYIAKTFQRLAEEKDPKYAEPGEPEVIKEREYFLLDDKGEPVAPPLPGHTDLVVWYPKVKVCFVKDSKFGRNPVLPAEMNYQLRCYAVMLQDEFDPDYTYAVIAQPYLPPPQDFHDVEYTREDIPQWRRELLNILADCRKENPVRRCSIEACMYCKARAISSRCPESAQFMADVARVQVMQLRPHELEALGPKMVMATNIIKAWDARIRAIADKYPALLKTYDLGPQQYIASISDPVKAFTMLYDAGLFGDGVPREQAMEQYISICCKASPKALADYARTSRGISESDAECLIALMLGRKTVYYEDGDNPEENCVLKAKPKQRSLRLKPSATKNPKDMK